MTAIFSFPVLTRRDTCFLGRLSQKEIQDERGYPSPLSTFVLCLSYFITSLCLVFIVSVTGLASDKLGWVFFMFASVLCLIVYGGITN